MTPEERFDAKVVKSETCWRWTGAHNSSGYGSFYADGRMVGAHRWAFERNRGHIKPGLVLDHPCRTRDCVNPDHLEAVSNAENVSRGENTGARAQRLNICKRGHSMSDAYRYKRKDGREYRICRTCQIDKARRARDSR